MANCVMVVTFMINILVTFSVKCYGYLIQINYILMNDIATSMMNVLATFMMNIIATLWIHIMDTSRYDGCYDECHGYLFG